MRKGKKEKVLVYTVYTEGNLDFGVEKEQCLKKYCEDKNYEIVEVVRKGAPYYFFEVVSDLVETFKKYNIPYREEFDKVITYDLAEIVPNNASLVSLVAILKDAYISLESIKQGKLNYNPLDKNDILSDDNLLDTYVYSKNEKYFVEEELPF